MTKKTDAVYSVDLTADEAIALVMLIHSGVYKGQGWMAEKIVGIADALEVADPELNRAQFAKWQKMGGPQFSLSAIPV